MQSYESKACAVKRALCSLEIPDVEMCWKACRTVVVIKASTTLTKLKSTEVITNIGLVLSFFYYHLGTHIERFPNF